MLKKFDEFTNEGRASYYDVLGNVTELDMPKLKEEIVDDVFGKGNYETYVLFEDDIYDDLKQAVYEMFGNPWKNQGDWETLFDRTQYQVYLSPDGKYIIGTVRHGGPRVTGVIFEKN